MKIPVDKHIHLEFLVPAFAEPLYQLTLKNRAHLKNWLAWLDLVHTLEDTQTFIDTAVAQHNDNQGTNFAIIAAGKLVGLAGFNQIDYQNKWGAIGYWLCASCTGKGVMTKVVKSLLEYGFVEGKLNKIEILYICLIYISNNSLMFFLN